MFSILYHARHLCSTGRPLIISSIAPLAKLAVPRQHAPQVIRELAQRRISSSSVSATSADKQQHSSWSVERGPPGLRGFSRPALAPYDEKEEGISRFKDWAQQAQDRFVKELPSRPASSSPLSRLGVAPASLSPQLSEDSQSAVSSVSQVLFDACWRRFEEKHQLDGIQVPREVVWLNGAPGAGKGVNTSHIMKTRGLETSLCLSDLLNTHPESQEIMSRGDMLPDALVGDLLLEALLSKGSKAPESGVLVDGFPRTTLQVDFLKMLNDKLSELHAKCANSQLEAQFPRPLFKVVMLYVDEETSVARQMARADQAVLHNKRCLDAGAGDLKEERSTDLSIIKCKKRYSIFKAHYMATLRLRQFFTFHLIDAMGSMGETQEAIATELRYQSMLDLGQETYQAIGHLPLAKDLVHHARQQLVKRLDDHCEKHPVLFQKVIDIVTAEITPILRESGMSGQVTYFSDLRIFNEHERAAQILIDVLTDRGFKVSHTSEVTHVPMKMNLETGEIENRKETRHGFCITWDCCSVGERQALELAARSSDSLTKEPRISQSFLPPPQQPPAQSKEEVRRPVESTNTNTELSGNDLTQWWLAILHATLPGDPRGQPSHPAMGRSVSS